MKNVPEIKAGYVLEILDKDTNRTEFTFVNYNRQDVLGMTSKTMWEDIDRLPYINVEILKVYGRTHNYKMNEINLEERELLWKREDKVKEMTLEEIIEELGYEIKIAK